MNLVDYDSSSASDSSSSGREDQQRAHPPKKRKRAAPKPNDPGHSHSDRSSSSTIKSSERATSKPALPPPPPPSFANLYATPVRSTSGDDPALHGGRVRGTAHVAGAWPSHVYIEWAPGPEEREVLAEVVRRCSGRDSSTGVNSGAIASTVHSLLTSPLGAPAPLHISLSRSLQLHGDQRQLFEEKLRQQVVDEGIAAFSLRLGSVRWVSNGQGTRWFMVVGVMDEHAREREGQDVKDTATESVQLSTLLGACNRVAREFGFGELYVDDEAEDRAGKHGQSKKKLHGAASTAYDDDTSTEPQVSRRLAAPSLAQFPNDPARHCHISIAWSLAPAAPASPEPVQRNAECTTLPHTVPGVWPAGFERVRVHVGAVKLKMGNVVTDIPLRGGFV